MHPKERYEEIITGKLQALPLPDMADAIWARVEAQLDLDMPSDDAGDVSEPSGPWGGGGWYAGAGLLALVGAIISYFYFQQPKSLIAPANAPATTVSQDTPLVTPGTPETQMRQPTSGAPPGNTAGNIDFPALPTSDTTLPVASTLVQQPDTIPQAPISQAPVLQQSEGPAAVAKTDSISKKPRGVQGVSDKDYRIVPKKDSTN